MAVVVLLFLTTGSIFYFIDFWGEYRYYTFTLEQFQKLGIEDSVYYVPNGRIDMIDVEKEYQDLKSQKFDSIKTIITQVNVPFAYYAGESINIVACDEDYLSNFNFAEQGVWLSEIIKTDNIPIVASGYLFANKKIGECIDIYEMVEDQEGNLKKGNEIRGEIVGLDREPSYCLAPGYSGEYITTDMIFQPTHNTVYMKIEDVKELFCNYNESDYLFRNAFPIIVFHQNASASGKQKVLDYLSSHGSYVTYEKIVGDSKTVIANQIRQNLPLPLFMLCVSTFAMMGVAIIITSKKMMEYRIYYLCGYSKISSYLHTFLGIGLICVISGFFNIMYVTMFHLIYMELPVNEYTYKLSYFIIGGDTVSLICFYILITVAVSTIIPFLLIKGNSINELYRRNT